LPNTEGEDITERLGIIKWEPVVPACLNGEVSGPRPSYIPMTDEPRIQSNPGLIEEYKGRSVYVSVKLDGTSSSFANYDGVFSVCGRNFCFKEGVENVYWEVAKKYNLEQKLKEAGNFAIQGECVGNGIQKNPLRIPKHDLYIFNVINLDNKKLLSLNEMKLFCKKYELQMVPVIFEGIFNWKTVEELLELSKGKYDSGVLREGIVIRPTEPSYSPILGGRSSFKVINSDYLLKFD
jgi:RNA ligase (TIGR02306 family)